MSSGKGWWYFKRRDDIQELIIGFPHHVKVWKDRFFFVGGSGWEIPSWEEDDLSPLARRSWGMPSMQSKALPCSFLLLYSLSCRLVSLSWLSGKLRWELDVAELKEIDTAAAFKSPRFGPFKSPRFGHLHLLVP